MQKRGKWILKTNDGRYLSFVDGGFGMQFEFRFTDKKEEALRYSALIRAQQDMEFFNERGGFRYKHMANILPAGLMFEIETVEEAAE